MRRSSERRWTVTCERSPRGELPKADAPLDKVLLPLAVLAEVQKEEAEKKDYCNSNIDTVEDGIATKGTEKEDLEGKKLGLENAVASLASSSGDSSTTSTFWPVVGTPAAFCSSRVPAVDAALAFSKPISRTTISECLWSAL